jgi:probable DNA repair protein
MAAAHQVWASVDVLTPAHWARRECERLAADSPGEWPRLLRPAEEWLLWREATQEAARDYPFLDSGLLAESLQHSSERAAEHGIEIHRGTADSEAALLFEAQRGFNARCQALNAASVSALMPRLRESAARRKPLLLRGFTAVPPWLTKLTPVRPPHAQTAAPRGVRTPDALSQLEAIAQWCCEQLRAQSDARLLVMLPGPAGPRERLAALLSDALDPGSRLAPGPVARASVAIEGGAPMGSAALPAHALQSLAILAGGTIDAELIGRWLTAPYWSRPAAAPRAHLARLLRERGPASVNLREFVGALQLAPRELRSAARELDGQLRHAAGKLGEGSASPRSWSERFEAALGALGWPGTLAVGSLEQQIRLRWRELLEEFGDLALSAGSLGLRPALELLRALALRTPFHPGDEGVPVTLSAVLMDPVVIYDGIWVGSLSADQLPLAPAPDPFLPLREQRAAGVSGASVASRRAEADVLLAAWRRGTRELVVSLAAQEEDRQLLPSPCLAGIALEERRPGSLWLPLRLHREGRIERIVDSTGTSFNPLTPLPSGTRALTLQNACAFRAYAELRLGAAPPEAAEPGVPMNQRGLLLHAALQGLWERLRDSQRLAALDESELDVLIGECVMQAARSLQAELGSRRRRGRHAPDAQFDLFTELSPALERECQRARALIHRLCALERTRPPFAVEATEHLTELSLGGGRLRLRLDRIDRLAGGRAVLDYKSGRAGTPDWYGERPTHPQLLAYLSALGADVVALATVNVTAREVRFTGVAASGDLLPRVKAIAGAGGAAADWHTQQRSWQALIARLIRAFLDGEARVDPAPGACDYCHITDICRIGAHLAPEGPGTADDADD